MTTTLKRRMNKESRSISSTNIKGNGAKEIIYIIITINQQLVVKETKFI